MKIRTHPVDINTFCCLSLCLLIVFFSCCKDVKKHVPETLKQQIAPLRKTQLKGRFISSNSDYILLVKADSVDEDEIVPGTVELFDLKSNMSTIVKHFEGINAVDGFSYADSLFYLYYGNTLYEYNPKRKRLKPWLSYSNNTFIQDVDFDYTDSTVAVLTQVIVSKLSKVELLKMPTKEVVYSRPIKLNSSNIDNSKAKIFKRRQAVFFNTSNLLYHLSIKTNSLKVLSNHLAFNNHALFCADKSTLLYYNGNTDNSKLRAFDINKNIDEEVFNLTPSDLDQCNEFTSFLLADQPDKKSIYLLSGAKSYRCMEGKFLPVNQVILANFKKRKLIATKSNEFIIE
ncbi:hypothetical protein DYU05_10045 [Mucilaginibacter terrenus]|uniref:Uncharacterized protein n=1 Tax=Mucilaginibacter terrenus TaxID=2482727 RepID=A0A3E2NY42_9SPHI|nr:hypothetical protein [Mucilaginibacter terrenus]RFZ85902.1 hypothetical protein DYU05_10045 [Mucilaginibacter terrenus]